MKITLLLILRDRKCPARAHFFKEPPKNSSTEREYSMCETSSKIHGFHKEIRWHMDTTNSCNSDPMKIANIC